MFCRKNNTVALAIFCVFVLGTLTLFPIQGKAVDFGNIMFLGSANTQGWDSDFPSYRKPLWDKLVNNNNSFHIVGSNRILASTSTRPKPIVRNGQTLLHRSEGHWHWTTMEILKGQRNARRAINSLFSGSGKLDYWLKQYTPHTAVVWLGFADILVASNITPTETITNLGTIIDKIKADNPNVQIFVGTLYKYNFNLFEDFDVASAFQQRRKLNTINRLLMGGFASSHGVHVVNLHSGFDWRQQTDGFLPVASGREIIAKRFYNAMLAAGSNTDTLHKLTVKKLNASPRRIVSQPGAIDCGDQCASFFTKGTKVHITIAPSPGVLALWQGCDSSTDTTCTVTMDQSHEVTVEITGSGLTGDINNDGTTDLRWHNTRSGKNVVWFMEGNKTKGVATINTVNNQNEQIVGFGDFNGDGIGDAFWRNAKTGENGLYVLNKNGTLAERLSINTAGRQWNVVGVHDFDLDGNADVLWRNPTSGVNLLYLMEGNKIKKVQIINTLMSSASKVVAVDDLDNDNDPDILWRNSVSGNNTVYLMKGPRIEKIRRLNTIKSKSWKVIGTGRFDNKIGIVWRNFSSGENVIHELFDAKIAKVHKLNTVSAKSAWRIVAIADTNGDGNDDLVWRNRNNGKNVLYRMAGFHFDKVLPLPLVRGKQWQVLDLAPPQ